MSHAVPRAIFRAAAAAVLPTQRPDRVAKKVARHLGVSSRTLQRYKARGNAPRAVYLALFFESRWGMSALHEKAFNDAMQARSWVASLERECERLKDVIRLLDEDNERPAANRGVYRAL